MLKFMRSTVFCLSAAAAFVAISGADAAAQTTRGEAGTPVGVWEIIISFRNCETGEILREMPGLISFMSGGVMQEFGTGSAPLDRSDAQGVWRHTFGRYFSSSSKAFRFAADGNLAGSLKLYRDIELSQGGDAIDIVVSSEIYDANGALVAVGCATESGTRLR
jgi:hypothetical protein